MTKDAAVRPGSIVFIDDAHTFGGAQVAMAWAIRVLLWNTEESIVCVSSAGTWKAVLQIAGQQPRLTFIECPSALPLNIFSFPLRVLPFFLLLRKLKSQGVRAWWLNLSGIEFCLAPRAALALLGEDPVAWLHNTERFSFFYKKASLQRRSLGRLRDFLADRLLFRIYRRLIAPSLSSVAELQKRTRKPSHPGIAHLYYPMITREDSAFSAQAPPVRRLDPGILDLWMIGRVEYGHKYNEVALDVLQKLIQSGRKAHLTVVGDGPDSDDFRQRVVKANLAEHVAMLGWQTAPWEQVPPDAIIFIPSVYESMSLVAREAMIRGLRLAASPIPVFLEWIPHELLAADFTSASFTAKILEVEAMNHQEILALYASALARFSDTLFVRSFFSYTDQTTLPLSPMSVP